MHVINNLGATGEFCLACINRGGIIVSVGKLAILAC